MKSKKTKKNDYRQEATRQSVPFVAYIQRTDGVWRTFYSRETHLKRPDKGRTKLEGLIQSFHPLKVGLLLDNIKWQQCPYPRGTKEGRQYFRDCILSRWEPAK